MRLRICLLATAVALAACGGSDDGAAPAAGPDAPEVPTTVASGSGEEEPTETSAPAGDSESGGAPAVDGDQGTITVGGETFLFGEGNGICTPDWQGQGMWFRADLGRVDEDGDPIEVPGMPDSINPAYFVFDHEGSRDAEDQTGIYFFGVVGSSGDTEWGASHLAENGSGVDSVTLDGNRAHGTATFVSSDGDGPVSGTFEVICADD